ncbi:MAG: hypothetical protein GF329_15925 [Candidatus Lokiarchaeota archaeon]|nr:hypothetical protein [Candidatus Lokiarchaeota archaeon]
MVNIIEQDMVAGIEYLKGLGNFDKIGLLGHSMGAMTALKTSEDLTNQVNATVIIGMSTGFEQDLHGILAGNNDTSSEYNLSKISNLLIANGIFEQMFTKQISLDLLAEYTNLTGLQTETVYGNFTHGNACKVVIGATEHLFEPHDYHIIYESVEWFEKAFYGDIRWKITVTSIFYEISFYITIIGILMLGFVLIIYIYRFFWQGKSQNLQKNTIKDTSTLKLVIFYLISMIIGVLIMAVGIFTFGEILPVSLGELLFGILAGTSIGSMIMYYIIIRKRAKLRDIPIRIKNMSSENYGRAIIYGVVSAALFALLLTSIATWSIIITIPTLRELGAILGMSILFFPWFLMKEFYFRTVQGNLKTKNNPIKEYFIMFGIGFVMDSILIIPLMILLWAKGALLGFMALALTVVVIFSLIQQCLVTWVYMYSGRNILGSSIFLALFYAWMVVNFYPFGLPLF